MKFGKAENPSTIDFILPSDHIDSKIILSNDPAKLIRFSVGYPKWNKKHLKALFPKNVKDELTHYATQMNSIEMNATYYRSFPPEQFMKWANKVPDDFRFYPKMPQSVSRFRKLLNSEHLVEIFTAGLNSMGSKLGMAFMQMDKFFGPKYFYNLTSFLESWPKELPLALELRHEDWYKNNSVGDEIYWLLKENNITSVLVDTHSRRDLLHMRHSTKRLFVRFVAADVKELDFQRLEEWLNRIKDWTDNGLEEVAFFIHRKQIDDSPFLAAYFIRRLNEVFETKIKLPLMEAKPTHKQK